LDLGLPDAQGFDALQSLLGLQPDLAIIVLTGLDDQQSGARALELGAQDYLPKGTVDKDVLTRSLRYAMARRGSEETSRKLREAELSRAENARLERGLLAQPMLHNPRLKWATRYQPGGRRALLGGDFYDAIELVDGTIRLVIGDVCGHGPDEAALGVALRIAWRSLVLADQPPDVVIPVLQRVLEAERPNEGIFATLCDMEIKRDLQSVQMRLAGHPSPLLITDEGVQEMPAEARGPVLGVFDEAKWPMNDVELGDRWTLVIFTDGIVEGRVSDGAVRLGSTGLAQLALRSTSEAADLEALSDLLINGAEAANGAPLSDDVALLLLSTSDQWDR
jgi:serine phosphatase RsbU (regulator of sigma subunit)